MPNKVLILISFCLALSFGFCQDPTPTKLDSEDDEIRIENFFKMADSLRSQEYPDSAFEQLFSAEILAESSQDKSLLAKVKYDIGKFLSKEDQYVTALDYYKEALSNYQALNDTKSVAKCYNSIGVAYKHLGVYSKAIEALKQSFHLYVVVKDTVGQGSATLNIGNVYKNIGKYEDAKTHYYSALNIFESYADSGRMANCYNNLGNVFKNEKKFDSARYFMHKNVDFRKQAANRKGLSFAYHNLANLHFDMNEVGLAKTYADSAFYLKNLLGDEFGIAGEYEIYARIALSEKDYIRAIENGTKALEICTQFDDFEFRSEVLKTLAFAHHEVGEYKKSSAYFKEFLEIENTLKELNESTNLEYQLIQFELVADSLKKQDLMLKKELEDAVYENEKLSRDIAIRNLTLIILALIILSSIIAFIYFQNRKRLAKSKKEKELLEKSSVPKEEKDILLKEVHHRVKNNFQIINSLIRIQSEYMNEKNFKIKLLELENRIRSMSIIHEKLYKTESLSKVNVSEYIKELVSNLKASFEQSEHVRIDLNIDESAEFGLDTLIPLGLILNEAISNSIQHAFEGRDDGTINVYLEKNEMTTSVTISDNGIGADLSIDELKEESLGMELIYDLIDQLDGTLELETGVGFKYSFKFPSLI